MCKFFFSFNMENKLPNFSTFPIAKIKKLSMKLTCKITTLLNFNTVWPLSGFASRFATQIDPLCDSKWHMYRDEMRCKTRASWSRRQRKLEAWSVAEKSLKRGRKTDQKTCDFHVKTG